MGRKLRRQRTAQLFLRIAAIPLLIDIRNAPSSDESIHGNAAAIRILTLGN